MSTRYSISKRDLSVRHYEADLFSLEESRWFKIKKIFLNNIPIEHVEQDNNTWIKNLFIPLIELERSSVLNDNSVCFRTKKLISTRNSSSKLFISTLILSADNDCSCVADKLRDYCQDQYTNNEKSYLSCMKKQAPEVILEQCPKMKSAVKN